MSPRYREHRDEDPWTYYERNQEYYSPQYEGGYDPERDRFVRSPEREKGQYPEDSPHKTYFRSTYQWNPLKERQTGPARELLRPGPFTGIGPKGYRRSDGRILDEVCRRLTEHPGIDAREIEVEVEDQVVRLSGKVPDRETKRLAEDIADHVSGVRDVWNEVRLERSGSQERPRWVDDLSQA